LAEFDAGEFGTDQNLEQNRDLVDWPVAESPNPQPRLVSRDTGSSSGEGRKHIE
jgi:hypothetical protein